MDVCIVIPMFNEARMAHRCLSTLASYANDVPDTTVLVVDDGSRDGTVDIVASFASTSPLPMQVLRHEHNQGYGAALQTGVRAACERNADYVLFMDSDLTNHPKYLSRFYEAMRAGHDYIKATRYSHGGGVEGVPWKSYCISRVGNVVARHLYGVPLHDVTNGFRAVRTSLLRDFKPQERGFAIIMEELYYVAQQRPTYAEVPYVLTAREAEEGVSSFVCSPQTMKTYLSYALKHAGDRVREFAHTSNDL